MIVQGNEAPHYHYWSQTRFCMCPPITVGKILNLCINFQKLLKSPKIAKKSSFSFSDQGNNAPHYHCWRQTRFCMCPSPSLSQWEKLLKLLKSPEERAPGPHFCYWRLGKLFCMCPLPSLKIWKFVLCLCMKKYQKLQKSAKK